ncbi:MAG TPA: HEAT repeat domain-containing protein [Chthonomonadales bacterium]|nr:HEAT repeat domain-containing protein [Chthonomonadales bacterium]
MYRFFHLLLLLEVTLGSVGTRVNAWAIPEATSLFRDEVIEAPKKLGWKADELSDETRFALAASGLSWRPVWQGIPLLTGENKKTIYTSAEERHRAFSLALQSGAHKEAFSFALSLVLEPQALNTIAWLSAYDYLSQYKEGFDRTIIGVLQAPEKVPLLPRLQYAAADVLVYRAAPRHLLLFMTLAESSDRYLRSRAIMGLGVICYRPRESKPDTPCWIPAERPGFRLLLEGSRSGRPLRAHSISAVQLRMVGERVRRAAEDKNYRVRAAAALALGLIGDETDLPLLEKLVRDRAYYSFREGMQKEPQRIVFPVREQAVAALARFGRRMETGSGIFRGKELKQAIRGCKNVTNDYHDVRRERSGLIALGGLQ